MEPLSASSSDVFMSSSRKFAYEKGDWASLFVSADINICYKLFLDLYHSFCEKYIPIRSVDNFKKKSLWITKELRRSIAKAHKLWYKNNALKWRDRFLKGEYENLIELNKKWVAKVVYEFESSLAERLKREPKLVYNYVRSKQRAKAAIRSLRGSTGVVHSDTGEMSAFYASNLIRLFQQWMTQLMLQLTK
jgi:hypothetical protein